MAKGKYKNKVKKNQSVNSAQVQAKKLSQEKKQYVKQKQKSPAKAYTQNGSKKFKLQFMDIITIVFTAIIIGIMIFVVYDQFSKSNDSNDNSTIISNSTASTATEAAATATPAPKLSDIGNIYGNFTNDASVAELNNREYFISNDDEGKSHIYVNIGEETKDLIQTDAKSLNVVTDYITHAGQSDVTAYYVFYINNDGNICYVKDGPVGEQLTETTNADEVVLVEGDFVSIDVSAEYVYHLNSDGVIQKTGILDKKTTKITSKRSYSDFVLYYGTIYAKGSEDDLIYAITTTDSKTTEEAVITTPCNNFAVDNNLIYVSNEKGLFRYSMSGVDLKETISNVATDALNVYKDAIFYISDGALYTCSAESLLTEEAIKLCSTDSEIINVSSNSVYIRENNKLCKLSYDKDASKYTEPSKMN